MYRTYRKIQIKTITSPCQSSRLSPGSIFFLPFYLLSSAIKSLLLNQCVLCLKVFARKSYSFLLIPNSVPLNASRKK